jgi:predicted regulator of Ras-like GTPase activity (Roadblock/LC7/MglB family)
MIRSCRIPAVLNRICSDHIQTALLVTLDGELLGSSTSSMHDPETLGSLVAEIALDYQRLGEDLADSAKSQMQALFLQTDNCLIGVCPCLDCLVIGLAEPGAPPGLVKARLQALAAHVQEGLLLLTETN